MKKIINIFMLTLMHSLCIVAMETAADQQKIHLVLTTALVENNKDKRKEEYIKSLQTFADMGYKDPYIVEGVQSHGPSFFEEHTDPNLVYYYPHNNPQNKNRGAFEGLSLAAALKNFNFHHNAIIYKQTGRYLAKKDLASIAKEYPDFDAYLKYSHHGYILLVGYLWKCGKLSKMLNELDYKSMEEKYDPRKPEENIIETYVTDYVKQQEQEKELKVFYIQDMLGIIANPQHSSTGVPLNSPTEY